jgi:hypothetical protein
MRRFQITLFLLGVAAFIASACFTGKTLGDTLWRAGVAFMLGDVVCLRLWPSDSKRPSSSAIHPPNRSHS